MKQKQKSAWLRVAQRLDDLRRLAQAAANGDEQARDELMNYVRSTEPCDAYVGETLWHAVREMGYEMDEEQEDGVDLADVQRMIDDGGCQQHLGG